MNAKDTAALAALTEQLKQGMIEALKPLAEQVAALTAANTALEQRSSNFAARVNAHNACYRAEIAALREEVLALKAGKKFTVVAERITTAAWDDAMTDLKRLNPGKTWFGAAVVKAHAAKLAAAPAVKALVGYTEGDPLLEEEDDYSM